MSTALAQRPRELLPEAVENLLATGNLKDLTTSQRIQYYQSRCAAAGLDPRTRPFEYISMQGKLVLYALKSCTDSLAGKHGLTFEILSESHVGEAGLYKVIGKVRFPDGRETTDMGIVFVKGLVGNELANAMMKALTKCKRRATLSACGLGDVMDETEIETCADVRECTETGELKAIENNSGFAKGQYCSDEDARTWLNRAEAFLQKRLDRWRDHWASVFNGVVPSDVHDPCNIFQLDSHLVKTAIEVGYLQPGSTDNQGLRRHQLGKLTGILWLHRGKAVQRWMIEECNRYLDEQERIQVAKIAKKHPELDEQQEQEEDEAAVDDDIPDGISDGFPRGGDA